MSDDRFDAELAKLRADVDRRFSDSEEKQKSRDPNIISAIRTLVSDIAAYVNGKREDFPREALVGVFGAYLRPRLVLIFGSIIATMIAAGEFYLIYRQNEIIERQTSIMRDQNKLVEQQTRLTRADTASRLLPVLRDKDSLASDNRALLATYGNVAGEVLLPIVKLGYRGGKDRQNAYVWMNAAEIVITRWEDLSPSQSLDVFILTLEAIREALKEVEFDLQFKNSQAATVDAASSDAAQDLIRISELFSRHSWHTGYSFAQQLLDDQRRANAAADIAYIVRFMRLARVDSTSTLWQLQERMPTGDALGHVCRHLMVNYDKPGSSWPPPYPGDLIAKVESELNRLVKGSGDTNLAEAIHEIVFLTCVPDLSHIMVQPVSVPTTPRSDD